MDEQPDGTTKCLWGRVGEAGKPTILDPGEFDKVYREKTGSKKNYKDQTELAAKQLEETRAQKDVEKRRINEKQIRSLRNNYRPSGGLLNSQSAQTELGTSSNLPNKLGA